MLAIGPEMLDDPLFRAAELRAEGISWTHIGLKLGLDKNELRRETLRDGGTWKKLMRTADKDMVAEAGRESLNFLRHHMRSEDVNVNLRAVDILVKLIKVVIRHQPKALAAGEHPLLPLEELSNEQNLMLARGVLTGLGPAVAEDN